MKLFGTHSERYLRSIRKDMDRIEALAGEMSARSDEELKALSGSLKKRAMEGENVLPEAFALVREAARRTIGLYPYKVQLQAARALYDGKIAEQQTGEGKTLTAVMPAYLMALEGRGVHIVTVNDYLAGRDSRQMGQVFGFLGLTTGCVLSGMKPDERKKAYACDITYVTNNELGFDYLRDNMVRDGSDRVLRGLYYAIIDEVDSILIDEARTPLIISAPSDESDSMYKSCSLFVQGLKRGPDLKEMSRYGFEAQEEGGDYMVSEKEKRVVLTAEGMRKAEKFFGIASYGDISCADLRHHIDLALRAKTFMVRDRDYIVKNGEVLIVDAFTGRIMEGRRYSDGLHQAIEAREKVQIRKENRTLATITFQNFFNMYNKKAGMTGTAMTEKREFMDIYGLDVIAIPTNRPMIREDCPDRVFSTKAEKFDAVAEEARKAHEKGQPVLIGTSDIETSQLLSRMLMDIPHQVLNAKQHEREAQVVEKAGTFGALTIATNMAGRGTDIQLDEKARQSGGLLVLGTQRHEARRIDNQLRGRSGRQGDPGRSQFFISLEDDMMRIFASEALERLFKGAGELSSASLTKAVEKAQKAMEGRNYSLRKSLMDYDRVLDEHRELLYAQREEILAMDSVDPVIRGFVEDMPAEDIMEAAPRLEGEKDPRRAARRVLDMLEALSGTELWNRIQKDTLLFVLDHYWRRHIDAMIRLKDGIGLQAKAGRDPAREYRLMADAEYDRMMDSIAKDTVMALCGAKLTRKDGRSVLSVDHQG